MKGYCLFCIRHTNLFPVKEWNKERINYYCDKHLEDAKKYNETNKRAFYEYYKEPMRFEWLTEENKELWRKIDSER